MPLIKFMTLHQDVQRKRKQLNPNSLMKNKGLYLLLLALVVTVGIFYIPAVFDHDTIEQKTSLDNNLIQKLNRLDYKNNRQIVLTKQRQIHILYGDNSGGGHKHGIGKPCKSEFPKDWDDRKIISVVKNIAANDNANWRQGRNGYYVTESMHENINVRVVLGGEKQNVITAYPINVQRNPCPANDR